MSVLNAVQIVESFWADVWVARNPEAVDRYAGGKILHNWADRNAWECYRRLMSR